MLLCINGWGVYMNKLKLINIQKCNKRVKKLYKEAFPRNERLPIFILNRLNKQGTSDFFEIYEKNRFIGMLYNVYYKDIVFILYLAIDNKLRGQGYGSKVLELIKDKFNEKRIILNIEQVNKNAFNNEQRLKRKKFYQNNGFKSLNFTVKEGTEIYEMLCYSKNNSNVDKKEYEILVKNFLGKFLYKVYKKISE